MTRQECTFERGDQVRLKSDKLIRYIVLGVTKQADGSYLVRMSQCGTGFPRSAEPGELELAY